MLSGAFEAAGGGSAKQKLQITSLSRKSVCCSVSKTDVCHLVAL